TLDAPPLLPARSSAACCSGAGPLFSLLRPCASLRLKIDYIAGQDAQSTLQVLFLPSSQLSPGSWYVLLLKSPLDKRIPSFPSALQIIHPLFF
ncbi:Os05g0299600, partial [Oryza sativa Japonica Group]